MARLTQLTLHEITRTVPIAFVNVSDPIGSDFVTSFPKPGGNITGFITMEPTMAGKWVELLKEIAPRVTNCVLLFNPATAPYADFFVGPLINILFRPSIRSVSSLQAADCYRMEATRMTVIGVPQAMLIASLGGETK